MKSFRISFILFFILFSSKAYAQTLSYSSGEMFECEPLDQLTLLTSGEKHLLYLLQSINTDKPHRLILKVNKSNLAIVEQLNLVNDKVTGRLEKKEVFGNDVYLFYVSEETSGSKTISYSMDALHINAEETLADYQNVNLGDFDKKDRPRVYYDKSINLFQIICDAYKYYDMDLKETKKPETKTDVQVKQTIGNFTDWRFKDIESHFLFAEKEIKGTMSYFYPLTYEPQIFLETFYKSDPNSIAKKNKAYTSIELSLYNSYTESKIEIYKVKLRPGLLILEFDAHVLSDTSVLIFGIYQEKGSKGGMVKLGFFSNRVDRNMKEITGVKYKELLEAKKDKLEEQTNCKYFLNWTGDLVSYSPLKKENAQNIVLTFHNAYLLSKYTQGFIKINKQTGEINSDLLCNEIENSMFWENFKGFYLLEISPTSIFVFYNDHKKNSGKTADPDKLSVCDFSSKSTVFSYVSYSTENGFASRTALVPASSDKFLMDIDFKDIAYLGVNQEGEHEFIIVAYDEDKKKGKFYKIKVKP